MFTRKRQTDNSQKELIDSSLMSDDHVLRKVEALPVQTKTLLEKNHSSSTKKKEKDEKDRQNGTPVRKDSKGIEKDQKSTPRKDSKVGRNEQEKKKQSRNQSGTKMKKKGSKKESNLDSGVDRRLKTVASIDSILSDFLFSKTSIQASESKLSKSNSNSYANLKKQNKQEKRVDNELVLDYDSLMKSYEESQIYEEKKKELYTNEKEIRDDQDIVSIVFEHNRIEKKIRDVTKENNGEDFDSDAYYQAIQRTNKSNESEEGFGDGSTSESKKKKEMTVKWTDPFGKEITLAGAKGEVLDGLRYESSMRKLYLKIHPTPSHLNIKKMKKLDENDFTKTTSSFIDKSYFLPEDVLSYNYKKEANSQNYPLLNSTLYGSKFHPHADILLTHSSDSILRLFQVDGETNVLIDRITGPKYIFADFTRDGKEIIGTSRQKFFNIYDIQKGVHKSVQALHGVNSKHDTFHKFDISNDNGTIALGSSKGYISLCSAKTKHSIGQLKMNSDVRDVRFSADSNYLFSVGNESNVYIWDMRKRRPLNVHPDKGNSVVNAIDVSSDMKYYATGSKSGIVNVYKWDQSVVSQNINPSHCISNLTMSINKVKFNHDNQMLGISSNEKEGMVRMVHVPSFRVFKNFPNYTFAQRNTIVDFDFSFRGNYLGLSCANRKCSLFSLEHYNSK